MCFMIRFHLTLIWNAIQGQFPLLPWRYGSFAKALPPHFLQSICTIAFVLALPANALAADTVRVTKTSPYGNSMETFIYVIDKQDTLSALLLENGKWHTGIDYKKNVVLCRNKNGLTMFYFSYANREIPFTLVVMNAPGHLLVEEHLGREEHGSFKAFEAGQLVLYGKYRHGNRWGFWFDCLRLPPYTCGTYFVFGRSSMGNREIIWSIPEFVMVCVYTIAIPLCLILSVLLALRESKMRLLAFIGIWLLCFLFSLPLPDSNWAMRVAFGIPFFSSMLYIPVRLVRGNTSLLFKTLGGALFVIELLISLFIYALMTTDFSH